MSVVRAAALIAWLAWSVSTEGSAGTDREACAGAGACWSGEVPGGLDGLVSLSTVPERLTQGLLEPTIRSLLLQTVVLPIIVAVPWRSKRFPDKAYAVPHWLNATPGVHVVRCADWGPSTKLIAALDVAEDDQAVIITVDDDTLYHPNMVENLLRHAARFPRAAVAHAGHRLWGPELDLSSFRSVEFLRPAHHARFFGRPVAAPVAADVLHSYAGALYRRGFFADGGVTRMYEELDDVGAAAFYVDDDWLSLHLSRRGIGIVVVPSPEPLLARIEDAQASGLNAPGKVARQISRQKTVVQGFIDLGWARLRPAAARRRAPGTARAGLAGVLAAWALSCRYVCMYVYLYVFVYIYIYL